MILNFHCFEMNNNDLGFFLFITDKSKTIQLVIVIQKHLSDKISNTTVQTPNNFTVNTLKMSLVLRKTVFRVSDQVRHKPGYTATEDGKRLEISDLDRRGIVVSM